MKAPSHAQHLLRRLASHLCNDDNYDPIIIIPSSPKTSGHLLHLPMHPSFMCSWDGPDCGFGLYFLPKYKNLIVLQDRDNIGPRITIYTPPKSGLLAITPKVQIKHVQRPAIMHPKNLTSPLLELNLPTLPTTHMNFNSIMLLIMTIRECLADPSAKTLTDLCNWDQESQQTTELSGIMGLKSENKPVSLMDRISELMQRMIESGKSVDMLSETNQGSIGAETSSISKVILFSNI